MLKLNNYPGLWYSVFTWQPVNGRLLQLNKEGREGGIFMHFLGFGVCLLTGLVFLHVRPLLKCYSIFQSITKKQSLCDCPERIHRI